MRTILLILIIAVVALIGAFATGYIDVNQTRGAKAPSVAAENGTVRTTGGQPPAFEVQTGSVQVGTREASVAVPKVEVKREDKRVKVPVVEVKPPEESQQNPAR